MAQAAACILFLLLAVLISGLFQVWARRILGTAKPDGERFLLVSVGAGIAFGVIVAIPLLVTRGQRGWSVETVILISVGAALVAILFTLIALFLARDWPRS
jgi:hypothetical protein